MSLPAIQIKNLSKTYASGTVAVRNLTLDIKKGEIFGLLGPNGAGKSTTINIICGGTKKTAGEVTVLGKNIDTHHTEIKYSLGLVPQELVYDRFLTVEETLQIQSGYYGKRNNQKDIDDILETLNLADKKKLSTAYLSGGMKRRLLVARALVHKPKIVILDEPTAGVDVELRQALWNYVRKLNQQGTTVILTTHYLEEAESMCNRIGVINNGQLMALGTVRELKQQFGEPKKRISFTTDRAISHGQNSRLANTVNSPPSPAKERGFPRSGSALAEGGEVGRVEIKDCPGFQFDRADDHFSCLLPESDIPNFFAKLKENDITISDIEIQSETLESVFQKILKKDI